MYRAAPKNRPPVGNKSGWDKHPATEPTAAGRGVLQSKSTLASAPSHNTDIFRELFALDLNRILNWVRHGLLWIVVLAVLGVATGYAVTLVIKPRYTASIDVLVDPSNLKVVADDIFYESKQRDTQLFDVASKLRIITSGNVLSRVVSDLKLAEDSEFASPKSLNRADDALESLAKHVVTRRDAQSFVVNVAAWSQSPAKSVAIVNSVVRVFQEELAKADSEGAGRAASTLFARLDVLKVEVAKADSAVEAFKRENGLQSSSGELVSTLMSNQTNTQLVDAKARLIQANTRYSELVSTTPGNQLNAASLQSETMTLLRSQYSTLKQRITSQSAIFGPRHPLILTLQPQLPALEDQINAETARILQMAKTELDQAKVALDALSSQAVVMKSSVFQDGDALIHLRELEREARAKSTVYEAFMARAGEAAERQRIDTTNVRVISPAIVPTVRSFPPRGIILAGAGGALGVCLGLLVAVALGLQHDYRRLKFAAWQIANV